MGVFIKIAGRERRHRIIRKKISGTNDRPRLSVYRSLTNLYAQVINDLDGKTIVSLSTNSPSLRDQIKKDRSNVKGAEALGTAIAIACKEKGIGKIVFDRGGYAYHGRIKAVAEAARKGGLQF